MPVIRVPPQKASIDSPPARGRDARPPVRHRRAGGVARGQQAAELPELGDGLFTHVVIRGLKGEADRKKTGSVGVAELIRFAEDVMPQLYREQAERGPKCHAVLPRHRLLSGLDALTPPGVKRRGAAPKRGPLFARSISLLAGVAARTIRATGPRGRHVGLGDGSVQYGLPATGGWPQKWKPGSRGWPIGHEQAGPLSSIHRRLLDPLDRRLPGRQVQPV